MLRPALPSGKTLLNFSETCLLAVLGGTIFNALSLPAGFLSGAMLFTALAALAGRPVGVPVPSVRVVFVAMGITLGGVVTPETLQGMATWPLSIAALGVTSVLSTFSGYFYLKTVHRWDPMSALLASTPGSLSQAMIHAHEEKADIRGVAIVQTIRSSILSIGVPLILTAFGAVGQPGLLTPPGPPSGALEYAILVGACLAASITLHKLRFPGGIMFGAMIVSAALHGSGLVHVQMPWWIVAGVMCGLGAIIGVRFADTSMRLLLNYIGAALGMFVVVVSVSMSLALLVATALDLRTSDVIVSFTPGALDVMMVLSLALHLDPVFVGAHHLSRYVLVSLSIPGWVSVVKRANPTPIPPPSHGD